MGILLCQWWKLSKFLLVFPRWRLTIFRVNSDKGNLRKEITLVDGEEIISSEMADTLNTFFENAVTSLSIPQIDHLLTDFSNNNDPIEKNY